MQPTKPTADTEKGSSTKPIATKSTTVSAGRTRPPRRKRPKRKFVEEGEQAVVVLTEQKAQLIDMYKDTEELMEDMGEEEMYEY